MQIAQKFQSTHPLRGATAAPVDFTTPAEISIHAPLAGCDLLQKKISFRALNFNPRTPCGVRRTRTRYPVCVSTFQSTHPLRGATDGVIHFILAADISIHAPLAGCDAQASLGVASSGNFNPRTPCGVRLVCNNAINARIFISTHAPLAGCDL